MWILLAANPEDLVSWPAYPETFCVEGQGVKVVWDGDGRAQVSAEYDDCKAAARRTGAPLRDVVRAAEEAGREQI